MLPVPVKPPGLGECEDTQAHDHHKTDDAPRYPALGRSRFVGQNHQWREPVAKYVPNAPLLADEQDGEEHCQPDDQHRSDTAPWTITPSFCQFVNNSWRFGGAVHTSKPTSMVYSRELRSSYNTPTTAVPAGMFNTDSPPAVKARSLMPRKSAAVADKPARSMSDSHKEALAIGREQGRAIRRYLEALEANKPRRGRKRTPEGIQKRLAAIDERLATADPLDRLHLRQERMDLEAELATAGEGGVDLGALEAEFVQAAGPYSQRKGITYDAWRAAGVEPRVLKAAGLGRGQ